MDDLISRQAAIEVLAIGEEFLKRVLDEVDVVGYERKKYEWGLDLIKSYISDMKELPPAQPEQRWIPVSERLPEANEIDEKGFIKAYLVQDARWMDVARWNGDVWIAWGYGTVLKDVTAWMPLPEPWKGEADADNSQI